MKKLILLLLLIPSLLFTQNYIEAEKKTTFNDNDGVFVHDLNANKTYGGSLTDIANYMFGSNRVMSGEISFTGSVSLPSTLASSLVRGVGYTGGLFSWINNDTVRIGADRAWVLAAMDTAGLAGATSNFVTKDGDNTLSGTNSFSYRTAFGGTNIGEVLIPNYTTTSKPTSILGSMYFNTSYNKLRLHNGTTWRTFLDSTGVASLVTSGTSWTTSTTQTGLTGSKTMSSGTLTPYKLSMGGHDAGRSLILPLDKNGLISAEEGSIFFDYNVDDDIKVHNGTSWITFPNETTVNTNIENSAVKWGIPISITNDTLDFALGSRFVIADTNPYFNSDSLTVPTHGRLYLKNDNNNFKTVEVIIKNKVWINQIIGVGGYNVQFPVGVTILEIPSDTGFIDFVIKAADGVHRFVGYGQYYAGW